MIHDRLATNSFDVLNVLRAGDANYLQACIHRELNRIHSDISSRGAAFMFAPPFSQGSTLEFQEVAVILTLWRPAFSREAIYPHERYQTSVPEWDRQFGLADGWFITVVTEIDGDLVSMVFS